VIVERLTDRLIAGACDCSASEVGAVYRFLLQELADEAEARKEFMRYLSGELTTPNAALGPQCH
jgi:hypothetical protein